MFKKIFAIATVMWAIPMMADAATKWQLGTRAMSQGGVINSRNMTGQTVAQGSLFKQYTTATNSTVTVTANPGFKISKITNNGVVSVPAGPNYTFTPDGTGSVTIQATFVRTSFAISATAGTGGFVDKTSYPIAYTGIQNPPKSFIFTPTPGQYVSSVTVTGTTGYQTLNAVNGLPVALPAPVGVKVKTNVNTVGTADVTVTAAFGGTAASTQVVSGNQCNNCHKQQGVGQVAYTAWSSSKHRTGDVQCYKCHVGANTGAHPGNLAQCASCHSSVAGHTAAANPCSQCHGSHSASIAHAAAVTLPACATCHVTETSATSAPHYGGAPFHKAQYVSDTSLPVSCADCHGDLSTTAANQAILRQFTSSSHGKTNAEAWVHFDWRSGSRSACQRCHAGTAFVAKLGIENNTTNVFANSDALKPGEVLNCSACHTDVATGAIRSAAQQFSINMTNGVSVTYDVVGASTLCARCHSGRATGDSITADPDTTGIRGFVDSHYQPAAGTLYNKAGYEYAGQIYDSLGKHKLLGATGQGPCVTCHMPGKNHTLDAASCGTCHNGVTAPLVNAADKKAAYDAALNDLKLALAAKGIHYGPVHPFFFTAPYVAGSPNTAFTAWGGPYGASLWKDTMGAAFNYNLLWSEKGAYAHNYDYAMKLIADSIDFINDGAVGL